MKKSFYVSITVLVFILVNACSDSTDGTVAEIKADYFNIGLGQSLYGGYSKVGW